MGPLACECRVTLLAKLVGGAAMALRSENISFRSIGGGNICVGCGGGDRPADLFLGPLRLAF